MPLDPQAKELIALLESLGDPALEESTPEAVRALRRGRLRPPTFPIHERRDVDAGGVPARLYRPDDRPGLGLFVHFHGGGWVLGDLDTHENFARGLAVNSGQAVLSIDYRLAPEHPFPAGVEDAVTATRWALDHADALGCDPERLAIGGDSSGANLAAVVCQLGIAPLRFQLLVYPVMDARDSAFSAGPPDGAFLTPGEMRWFRDHYLSGGQGSPDDPRVSPALGGDAALAGSPQTLVITAAYDPLCRQGADYADRLQSLGVATSHRHYDGMFHGFMSFVDILDAAREALEEAGSALRGATAPSPSA